MLFEETEILCKRINQKTSTKSGRVTGVFPPRALSPGRREVTERGRGGAPERVLLSGLSVVQGQRAVGEASGLTG